MQATINYGYIANALMFIRTDGILVSEVKSRGGDTSKPMGVEIKCEVYTVKGARKYTINFAPDLISIKKGYFGLKTHTIHLPKGLNDPRQYIQGLWSQLGVVAPSEKRQPSYYARNTLLSLLLERQVVDFDIKEEKVTIYNFGTVIPFIQVKYKYETFDKCSYDIRTVNTQYPQQLEGLMKPYDYLYAGLKRFLEGR